MIEPEKLQKMYQELLDLSRVHLKNVDEDLLNRSFRLSTEAHKNHFRESGESYFYHPYAVAKIIAEEIPVDDISLSAALLHDVVEDTDITIDFIKREFGAQIASIVDGVTKIGGVFKGQEINQAENYRKMLLSMVKDLRVILVKFADRLHNMRTLEYLKPEKQRRIAKETLEIYAPFANRFGLGKVKWELEDLAFKYLNKEAYNEIAKKLKDKRREREAFIAKFIEPLKEKLEKTNLKFEIGGRPKHIYSIYRKMIKQNISFDNIFDLFAIRIIIDNDDPNLCFYVLGIINQTYKPIAERFKDYISIPKKNNYQSLHNTVIGKDGRLVEIQIRTRKMHEIAENGVAAHWKYKESGSTHYDKELEDWVNWIRDVFESVTKNEVSKEILQSFELNLYQDEIYVFTPKGDLKRLPQGSTPVDFAYDIHSNVGYHCIGAKVNGKIVPLSAKLNSGDLVEILTSKNQHPNKSWTQFVVTHKAKSSIRKFIKKEEETQINYGIEIWERKLKKEKLSFDIDEITKLIRKLKYDNQYDFYRAIAEGKVNLDEVLNPQKEPIKEIKSIEFKDFISGTRSSVGGVLVDGTYNGMQVNYASCCNPIPGDQIVGFITIGEGIKIHRKDCKNMISLANNNSERFIKVKWPETKTGSFIAGIKLMGDDIPGLLKDISNTIVSYENTNIKAVNISATDSMFDGTITVYVNDLKHLKILIEKLKNTKGIYSVERFDSETAK